MAFKSIRAALGGQPVVEKSNERAQDEEVTAQSGVANPAANNNEKIDKDVNEQEADSDIDGTGGKPIEHGVEAARAVTQVWSMPQLILAYILIWVIAFVQAFSQGMITTLTPYVTSNFGEHSLTSTVLIVSSLVSGLIKLPYAKLMNIWGRPQAFGIVIIFMTMGLIMMAGCNSVTTYAAAQVFYSVGYSTIDFTNTIFIADTSSLKSRAFMIAFSASPWMATVWAYGPAVQSVLNTIGFRWGIGIWAIVYPVVTLPLFGLFYFNQKKAEKRGLISKTPSGRTLGQSVWHYLIEFDVVGILLIAGGLALFLLGFALYSYQADTWRSPMIICFLIFGGLLVVAFVFWERFFAPVTFIPWYLMKNRTVFFTYTMVASIYTSWYIWDNYFYSILIVVFRQSVTHATYITQIYTVGSCFCSLIMGVIIRFNGRLKWLALYFGVPLTVLGVSLMIHFRQPGVNIGYIVMCQIFIAFGGGILVICEQMTVMAESLHQDIPQVLAVETAIANVGGSIGSAIAAALWTGIFPVKLAKYLPAESQADFTSIYGSLDVQASYPDGSATRDAITRSYGDTQRIMLITATSLYSISIFSVLMWKDINVKKIKQVKGLVW